jgi:hypothetical protein
MSAKFRRSNSISNVRTNPITTPLKSNRYGRPMLGSLSEGMKQLDEEDEATDKMFETTLAAISKRRQDDYAKMDADIEARSATEKEVADEDAWMMCRVFGLCAVSLATAAAASTYIKGGHNKKTKRRRGGAYKNKKRPTRRR